MDSRQQAIHNAMSTAEFMAWTRPDVWDTPEDALDFIKNYQDLEYGDFVSTAGFTVFRDDNGEISVTLDLLHLFPEEEYSFSWLGNPDLRNKFRLYHNE